MGEVPSTPASGPGPSAEVVPPLVAGRGRSETKDPCTRLLKRTSPHEPSFAASCAASSANLY